MIEPTETLRAEHKTIRGLLSVLDGMAARMRSDIPIPRDDLDDVMTVVIGFADRCHQTKEEDVLFPALVDASPHTGAMIARRLTSDHQALRRIVASMNEFIPRLQESATARARMAKFLMTYSRVLQEHIRTEEGVLLPEFERSVEPAGHERVFQEFVRLEREDVGWRMHDAYRAIVHRLGEVYVG